jgi:hypothetical protein
MNPFLAQTFAAMNAAPVPMATGTAPVGQAPAQPDFFGLGSAPPVVVKAPPPEPPPPDPHASEELQMSVAPSGQPTASVPIGPPSPAPVAKGNAYNQIAAARDAGNAYPLQIIPGSGVIKAHELERRGPSLLAAQGTRNLASEQTIDRVSERNQDMAAQEQALALDQERQARAREAAMAQSFAERDEEMAQRQSDFDATVKQLGKLGTIDRDRFWASRSTGQKIAGFIEMALSGFNRAPSMVMKRIDDDVKAQEFAFFATRDTAQAKQTAFAQAMQKYSNADAARAAARAAAVDTVQAQLAQMSAKWKGTEAANRADMASAALQDEKMMQIANGIQLIPAQSVGRRFYDPRTGLVYSEQEAKAMSAKVDERNFENLKQDAGIGGQMTIEQMKTQGEMQKAQLAAQKNQGERIVKLPNGDLVQAPTDKEAEKLRDLSASVWDAQQLVNEAIQIRSDPSWAVSPTKRGRLEQIQSNLVTAFKDNKGLGALSGPDMDLARGGTANLLSGMPGTDAKLQAFADSTTKAVQNRVRGIAGAPDTAQGKLPPEALESFTPHGKK